MFTFILNLHAFSLTFCCARIDVLCFIETKSLSCVKTATHFFLLSCFFPEHFVYIIKHFCILRWFKSLLPFWISYILILQCLLKMLFLRNKLGLVFIVFYFVTLYVTFLSEEHKLIYLYMMCTDKTINIMVKYIIFTSVSKFFPLQ